MEVYKLNSYFGLDKKRCETRRIADELDVSYRFILWTLVDSLRDDKNTDIDYLQVFEFICDTDGAITKDPTKTYMQRIIHTQEVPEYRKEYDFPAGSVINGKIFVIDDGDHCTMLWADEY